MKKRYPAFAGVGAALLGGVADADFIGTRLERLGDLGGGTSTWRVHVEFDSPADTVLAVSGNDQVEALVFCGLGDALVNEAGPLGGLDFEDVPSLFAAEWDSWVTIGNPNAIGNDTSFSPGFLSGGDGSSVIHGSHFTQLDNGGWFDDDPGTVDGAGPSVLIAQFTIRSFALSGTLDWRPGGSGLMHTAFAVAVPAPGTLLLLGLVGLAGRRRG